MSADGQVWRQKHAVAQVPSPDRVAMLDLDHLDRPPLILNGSGAVIWQLLDGTRSVGDVTRAVAEHFGVSTDEVTPAVDAFLTELGELGLLERTSADGDA